MGEVISEALLANVVKHIVNQSWQAQAVASVVNFLSPKLVGKGRKNAFGENRPAIDKLLLDLSARRAGGKEAALTVGTGGERVLVLGDDMRIFLAVVRSLGRAGKEVHAAPFNWHSPALRSRYISKVHRLPRYSDNPAAWRASVRDLLRDHSFELVMPCDDRAILPLHIHRDDFAGARIAIPAAEAMDLLFDKERTRQLCGELGVPVASGARLEPGARPEELSARFGLPLVIKPRRSYWLDRLDAAGKVWIVESEAELAAVLAAIGDPSRYLVESYFDGVGVGVSVLANQGQILQAFQHRRLRQGKGGCSSYRISEPVDEELRGACEKICASTGLTGICMFEFRQNRREHSWILIETNARFWGSMPLPVSLGVDFPSFLYDLLVHEAHHAPVAYPIGIRSRNLMLDGLNLLAGLRELQWGHVGRWGADVADYVVQPVRWLSGRERSDSFVRDDLRPALWECAILWRSLGHKLIRQRHPEPRRRGSERPAVASLAD